MKLNILTFNLKNEGAFCGKERLYRRMEHTAAIIRVSCAEIVGVQEMTARMRTVLSLLLPEYRVVGSGRGKHRKGEHTDLLIRTDVFEVIETDTFWLSGVPERIGSRSFSAVFPRICTTAKLRRRNGAVLQKELWVFNTHLDHLSPAARRFGVELILSRIHGMRQKKSVPFIWMGDFNAGTESPLIRYLSENQFSYDSFELKNAAAAEEPSADKTGTYRHDIFGKKRSLDYIFLSSECSVLDYRILHDIINITQPSDHYPVLASVMTDEIF